MHSTLAPWGTFCVIFIIGILSPLVISLSIGEIEQTLTEETTVSCNAPFQCPPAAEGYQNPFEIGHEYGYFVNINNSLWLGRDLFYYVDVGHLAEKRSSTIDIITITPLSSCEISISFRTENRGIRATLKVAMVDGVIKQTCYSKKDVSSIDINVLKAIASMLQTRNGVLEDSPSGDNIELEESSLGTCMTKYVQCPDSGPYRTMIKYQSSYICGTSRDSSVLLMEYDKKLKYFGDKIQSISKVHSSLCQSIMESAPLEAPKLLKDAFLNVTDISTCLNIVDKENSSIIISACTEKQDLLKMSMEHGFSSSSIDLEIVESGTFDKTSELDESPFYLTGLMNVASDETQTHPGKLADTVSKDFSTTVLDVIDTLTNSINESSEAFVSSNSLKLLKSLVRSQSDAEVFMKALNTIMTSPEEQKMGKVKLYLEVVAYEAGSLATFQFFENLFSDESLIEKLNSLTDIIYILEKLMNKLQELSPSEFTLKFLMHMHEFIHSHTFTNSASLSKLKFKSLITVSEVVDKYCSRMELKTGQKFCLKDTKLSEWFDSKIIKRLERPPTSKDEYEALEAISMFHLHFDFDLCQNMYGGDDTWDLWTLLNCNRQKPCATTGKHFLWKVIQNKTSLSNAKVSAFLGLANCLDEADQLMISNVLENYSSTYEEFVNFLRGYKANREFYGIHDLDGIVIPTEEATMLSAGTNPESKKFTRASNSIFILNVPGAGFNVNFETNIIYFDKVARIPNVITMKLSTSPTKESDFSTINEIAEIQVLIDDHRDSEKPRSMLDFNVHIISRFSGRSDEVRKIPLTKETLLQISNQLQQLIKGNVKKNSWISWLQTWLHDIDTNDFKWDILKLSNFPQSHMVHPTISGISYRHSKKIEGDLRLRIEKEDSSETFTTEDVKELARSIQIDIEQNIGTSTYIGMQNFGGSEQGWIQESHVSITYPISLRMLDRTEGRTGDLEGILSLTLPSLRTPFSNHQIAAVEVKVKGNVLEESNLILGGNNMMSFVGPRSSPIVELGDHAGPGVWSQGKMNVVLTKTKNGTSVEISDSVLQGKLNWGSDPLYLLQGNVTFLLNPDVPKHYFFKAVTRNSENDKRLYTALEINNKEEYVLDAYYLRKLHDNDGSRHHGYLSCGNRQGTGILCFWPFCFFCGSEYYMGAKIVTPSYQIKLFEGSVTQVFPHERIDIVLETKGIPMLRMGSFKFSLQKAKDASIFEDSAFQEPIQLRIKKYMAQSIQHSDEPEVKDSNIAYLLNTELNVAYLGRTSYSGAYMSIEREKSLLRIHGGKLKHGNEASLENAEISSYLYTNFIEYKKEEQTKSDMTELDFHSSCLPILDTSLILRSEVNKAKPTSRTTVELRPVNLMEGVIRVEIMDYVGETSPRIEEIFRARSLNDLHINQTYKVYLPRHLKINNLKTKLVLKRVNGEFHVAGIDSILGFDHGFEFKYQRLPEEGNTVKISTSVTSDGEFYGLHHKIEPTQKDSNEVSSNDEEDIENLPQYKYSGTYVLSNTSLKAKGYFTGRRGKEILPFSKFDIRVGSFEGANVGVRIFGGETVLQDRIHKMKIGANKGDAALFEAVNEMNPDDEFPLKATISIKDFGEVRIFDTSKFKNSRNLQIQAKFLQRKETIEGKIAFPITLEEPLYFDANGVILRGTEGSQPIFKMSTSSSLEYTKNFAATSENSLQLRDSKWEFNLEGLYENEVGTLEEYTRKQNLTFSIMYTQPDDTLYGFQLSGQDLVAKKLTKTLKYYLKAQRPHISPLHLQLELNEEEEEESELIPGDSTSPEICETWGEKNPSFLAYGYPECKTRKQKQNIKREAFINVDHQDNVLYIFPKLNVNFTVGLFGNYERHERDFPSGFNEGSLIGNFGCKSDGIWIPACDQINVSFSYSHEFHDKKQNGPWISTCKAVNNLGSGVMDELNFKLHATYDPIKTVDASYDRSNELLSTINTIYDGATLMKNSYNIEYDLHRSYTFDENQNKVGLNGTYLFTKMFESLDNFEFFDEHRWKVPRAGNFHIWTNRLNHTVEVNRSSEYASIQSQYVSLGDGDTGDNVTYMELRSSLNSKGFGPMQTIIMQPSKLAQVYEGGLESDFLIRSDLTFLRNLRIFISHDQNANENEEEESVKYETLSKVNGILNDREISLSNSLTLVLGKLIGAGNTLSWRWVGPGGIYEYETMKCFVVAPKGSQSNERYGLIHVDLISSYTDAGDDDKDFRVIRDIIYDPTGHSYLDIIDRYSEFTYSRDNGSVENTTFIIYSSEPGKSATLRVPDHIFSENLDELNFSQVSLYSISQQIIEDYYNASFITNDGGDTARDYHMDYNSISVLDDKSSNYKSKTRLFGIQEKVFQCEASYETCYDNGVNNTNYLMDTSNYCNLAMFPVKHLIYLD